MADIPFNRPFRVGNELRYIEDAIRLSHLSGDGPFTKRCQTWIEDRVGCTKALLTHSCTASLEMAALLLNVQPGDEIVMPSYTFPSTANAFVLRGGVPVFVDIRPDTLNLDEGQIEAALTPRTRAIAAVHYAGVGCEMDAITSIARRHQLAVVEDAAQAVMSRYKGRPLGGIGAFGALSFHETKNVIAGEGGCLLLNDPQWVERAEILREKGTNRALFFRGQVDKYRWVDLGSSYIASDILAAFLWAQLQEAESITCRRRAIWDAYHGGFAELERQGRLRRPVVPTHCEHNAHMYYLLLEDLETRTAFLARLKADGIYALFHYVPLHSSPAGIRYGRTSGDLVHTDELSERVVRLPLWVEMGEPEISRVIDAVVKALQ